MNPRTLMVVHAHPDDESSSTGGTLAAYAAAGWRTVLVTCTDGAQGDGAGGPEQVAARRAGELALAAQALGITDVVTLGYPDSGVSDDAEPESFSRRPQSPMISRLADLIREYAPGVVVTYPSNGLSGHPDHIRTHDLVSAALQGIEPAPALYYIALSQSRLRAAQDHVRALLGPDAWVPNDDMATPDADITTVIDVAAHWRAKLEALAAHASQSDAGALLAMFSAADGAEHVEEYVRVQPPAETGLVESGFAGSPPALTS